MTQDGVAPFDGGAQGQRLVVDQARLLKRQLSSPVSRMSQRWSKRWLRPRRRRPDSRLAAVTERLARLANHAETVAKVANMQAQS